MSKEKTKNGCALFAVVSLIGGGISTSSKSCSKAAAKSAKPLPVIRQNKPTNELLQSLPELLFPRDRNKDRN